MASENTQSNSKANAEKIRVFFRKTQKYRTPILLIIVVVLISLLFKSDVILKNNRILPIKNVQVESIDGQNLRYISEESLSESVEFAKNNNYISLNTGLLTHKVVEESSFARDVIVSKSLPGNVVISVLERTPLLTLAIQSYGCVLLDEVGYVLDKSEETSSDECAQYFAEYNVPALYLADTKVSFTINERSSFYIIEDIYKILLTVDHYKLTTSEMSLDDNVLTIKTPSEQELVFSMNQPIEDQLKRLVAVMGQITQDSLEFSHLDLRYRRPVLRQK